MIDLKDLQIGCINHPNPDVDLVAIPIAPILNKLQQNGIEFYYMAAEKNLVASDTLLNSLPPMEEIVMIGYPNGLWDKKHNLPIIRKGITATHPGLRLNDRPEFLIDAACFPGSSGSPVFLANIGSFVSEQGNICTSSRIALLGTLYAGPQYTTTGEIKIVNVPTDTKAIAVGSIPINLGYVIHVAELAILEEAIKEALRISLASSMEFFPRNSKCRCGSGKRTKECCGITK